jgi:hypothetical protein
MTLKPSLTYTPANSLSYISLHFILTLNFTLRSVVCISHSYLTRVAGVAQSVRTGQPGFDPRQRQRIFPLPSASRPALGPTQPPVQWVLGVLSPGVKRGRGVMLTTHPILVPRLRNSRSYTTCHPNAPLWSVTGPLFARCIRTSLTDFDSVYNQSMRLSWYVCCWFGLGGSVARGPWNLATTERHSGAPHNRFWFSP